MIRTFKNAKARLANTAAQFTGREDGNSTVEFIVIFPIFMTMLMSGAEIGLYGINGSMLERGLEMAARDVRLGLTGPVDADSMRQMVCEYSATIKNCTENLRIEMTQVSSTDWALPNNYGTCIDRSQEVQADVTFENGNENELMVVRACLLIDPIFPTSGIGKQLETEEGMGYGIYATTAFVYEPNT